MEPEKIMEGMSNELLATIKAMAKAKTVEEKVAYSQVVKNLSESMGVFLSLAETMMDEYDFEDDSL
jgi:hypothetical protein